MRVVLDANVLIPAVTNEKGRCAQVLRSCMGYHAIFTSDRLVSEIRRVMRKKLHLSDARINLAVAFLDEWSTLAEPVEVEPDACRDPDDLHVLGLAVAAEADCIVTGDNDLLVLSPFRGIPILSPNDFDPLV